MSILILLLACAPEAIQSRREPVDDTGTPTIRPDSPRPARGLYCVDLDLDGWGDGTGINWGNCTEDQSAYNYAPVGDCDDFDPDINPDMPEICDGRDNDCSDVIDDGLGEAWYQDSDTDGYGNPSVSGIYCDRPSFDYVRNGDDCNDADSNTHPGAHELADGVDNNCDGQIDEV